MNMLVLDGQRAKRSPEEVPGPGVHGVQGCTGVCTDIQVVYRSIQVCTCVCTDIHVVYRRIQAVYR